MKLWSQLIVKVSIFALVLVGPASAMVFYNQIQAIDLAFPEATRTDSETFILTDEQVALIEKAGRSELASRLVTVYRGWRGDTFLGYAHIDVHTVRSKPEGLLVVLDPEAEVLQTLVLAFHEPLEYMPTDGWYQRFINKSPDDDLRIGFDVDAVTGATLTTRATVDSVRRMFAYYEVLFQPQATGTLASE